MTPTKTLPPCIRCDHKLTPDEMVLPCPGNPEPFKRGESGMHEVLDPPEWRAGDAVRPGYSLHVGGCPRANPSVYANYEVCECHMATTPGRAS